VGTLEKETSIPGIKDQFLCPTSGSLVTVPTELTGPDIAKASEEGI